MTIIFFAHPLFLGSRSMNRFANLLAEGMQTRGHQVELWLPKARFEQLKLPASYKKWLGYVDQYIVFPAEVRRRLKSCPTDTLFVFTDHALGPWVPLVVKRPHIIHCHDLLAQRSALGEILENKTGWTGRQYQDFIRRGFQKGRNFVSDSQKTKEDLARFTSVTPLQSEMVYVGLDVLFKPSDPVKARRALSAKTNLDLTNGYILHVGANVWYKNRPGVIDIYNDLRRRNRWQLPLLMIGPATDSVLVEKRARSPFSNDIHLISDLEETFVPLAYAGASLLLFPSLAEGFGWPIAEAMACGCPVVTTNEAPMTEVAGNAAFFIPRRPHTQRDADVWAEGAGDVVDQVLGLSDAERKIVVEAGFTNAKRFNTSDYLDKLETLYQNIVMKSEAA